VLEQGRIVAQGRHAELLLSSPLYAQLAALQFGEQSGQTVPRGAVNDPAVSDSPDDCAMR
jgi:ATP-binding cassette subfamily B protein